MRISDIDPDELDDDSRPQRRKVAVVAAAVVALGGVIGAVALIGGDDEATTSDSSTTIESSDATDPVIDPGFNEVPAPDGFPDYGSDYMGPELETMFQRTTDAGIRLTLQNSGDWQNFAMGDVVAETIAIAPPDMPPGTGVDSGWVAPPWCTPIGGFRLTMTFKDAIGVSNGSRYAEPRGGLAATLFTSGYAEGAPFRALVLHVGDDVLNVSATWDDDATDTATPVNGWVVVATPGQPSGKFELVMQTDAGERVIPWNEIPQDGDLTWQKDCSPPPPELPAAGEQPDDAEAAEEEIRAIFDQLFDNSVAFEDKAEGLLDDTTGIQDALDEMRAGGFAEAAETALHTMTDFVFVSPTEAWFKYDLETIYGDFPNRFGIAYLIDGQWRIARAVVCQDLSLTGVPCNPPVFDIYPAVG